jgi:hypothetical protein
MTSNPNSSPTTTTTTTTTTCATTTCEVLSFYPSILEGLGNRSIASIEEIGMEIHQHPEMIEGGKRFHDARTKYRSNYWFHYPNCKERSFETNLAGAGAKCTPCSKSRLSNTNRISVFSAANKNCDPIPIMLPTTLPVFTHIEEMLIVQAHM